MIDTTQRLRGLALALTAAGLLAAPAAFAQSGPKGPMIASVGSVDDIAGAAEKPDPTLDYKIVFDIKTMGASDDAISPALTSMASLLNTYRKFGVPADHIHATAVFHGSTILLVTKDETYRARSGAKANPNAGLVRELVAAGVKLVVCGVSARDQHYETADLLPSVQMNLSATVTFLNLQTRGYVKVDR